VAVREAAGETPLGRPSPEDVAGAVAFLLRVRATSGCVIPVDGGQSLAVGGPDA
jgi:NAD(P)-dependent dehydrogenase (short-subunit alcohol dehydrogenase family)